ncbi:MAG: alpha/beta hydrolase family protein [Fimbriimonadaceae bacterium]|nr:alpha/beta hydrolase family protein [Fimbriimonadaceae bacterium]
MLVARARVIITAVALGLYNLTLAQVSNAPPLNPFVRPAPYTFSAPSPTESNEFWRRYTLDFDSAMPSGVEPNDTVPILITVPTEQIGKAPVVILLHYWGATDQNVEKNLSDRLAKSGIASIALPIPYHLQRTPPNTRSGEMAITADPAQMREVLIQAMADLSRTIDWIETQENLDSSRVGLAGISLGAIVSSLGYGVEPRIKAAAFMLGGADLAGIFFSSSRTVPLREEMRRRGYTPESLRQELAPVEPLTYLRADDPRPTYIIRARFDTVVMPGQTQKLMDALPGAKLLELDTGHFGGAVVQNRLLGTVSEFFVKTFRNESFSAPTRFFAPTLRFGAIGGGEEPLTFFGGFDLWRSGSGFASILVTPQGPRGFLGAGLGREWAVGIYASPRRTTWGILWNIVL